MVLQALLNRSRYKIKRDIYYNYIYIYIRDVLDRGIPMTDKINVVKETLTSRSYIL